MLMKLTLKPAGKPETAGSVSTLAAVAGTRNVTP